MHHAHAPARLIARGRVCEANIATLMSDDPEPASRARRARERALAIAPRAPGYEYALGAFQHDHRHGGGLLAGALAFRLFGALLPLALLITVILGYATSVDQNATKEAGEAVGLGPTLLESVGESAKLSTGTRWSVALFAVVALLWSANSAARAIRAVHSLAWEGRVGHLRRPLPAALALLLAIAAFGAVFGATGKARAELGSGGLLISIAAIAAFAAIWLGLAWLLPHGDADWRELIPGRAGRRARHPADPSRHRALHRRADRAGVGDLRLARRGLHASVLALRHQPGHRRLGDAQRRPRTGAEAHSGRGASRMTQPWT